MNKKIFTAALLLITAVTATAQFKSAFKNNYAVAGLINNTLQNEPHLSYLMTFTYADSVPPATSFSISEQVSMDVKMATGKMYYAADSIIEIEGFNKHISISLADSVIILTPKRDYTSLFQAALMDSIFEQAHIDSAKTTENFSDSTGTINFFFKPTSYYKGYSLKYHLNKSYKFLPIQFKMTYRASEATDVLGRVQIDFTNYTRNPAMNKIIFNEMQYVTMTINGYVANAPFTGFTVIDETTEPIIAQ